MDETAEEDCGKGSQSTGQSWGEDTFKVEAQQEKSENARGARAQTGGSPQKLLGLAHSLFVCVNVPASACVLRDRYRIQVKFKIKDVIRMHVFHSVPLPNPFIFSSALPPGTQVVPFPLSPAVLPCQEETVSGDCGREPGVLLPVPSTLPYLFLHAAASMASFQLPPWPLLLHSSSVR